MDEPIASRPHMPGYDIAGMGEGTLLPWSWAEERLTRSHDYWLTTVRPDGRPHVMPVWGVWHAERFFFSASPASRRIHNLETNARVVVTTESAVEGVVVEGTWAELRPGAELDGFAAAYDRKYDWDIRAQPGGGHYLVTPTKAFAVLEHESGRTTRWTFA